MTETLLIATLALQFILLVVMLVRKPAAPDLTQTHDKVDAMRRDILDAVRKESEIGRDASAAVAASLRTEVRQSQTDFAKTITDNIGSITAAQDANLKIFAARLDTLTQALTQSSDKQREEVAKSLTTFNESVLLQLSHSATSQRQLLDSFSERLTKLTQSIADDNKKQRDEVTGFLKAFNDSVLLQMTQASANQRTQFDAFSERVEKLTQSIAEDNKKQREEVARVIKDLNDTVLKQLGHASQQQTLQFDGFSHKLSQFGQLTTEHLDKTQVAAAAAAKLTREEIAAQLKLISETMAQRQAELSKNQKDQLEDLAKQVKLAIEAGQKQAETLREAVEKQLVLVREDNTKQLELMRTTVDEKLQGTLEKRLGESFKIVSERLEQVHKGLGEMQTLASGVGDLKKVLSNVKVRGNWGEVQLGNLLEQLLTPDQYEKNVAVTGEGRERVEFAIKLPGKSDDEKPVWLPIDAKFPQDDYQRLVDASERADVDGVEASAKALTDRVKSFARDIRDKYIKVPATTEFGILFLPTEGLYAEVLRRPGVADDIQRDYRILIAGPTTLTAVLSSLQMGFRTLAIQKQSSEVWKVLGAVKTDFGKFKEVLDKVKAQLETAAGSIEKAQDRTRLIGNKLQKVQELPANEAQQVLGLPTIAENGEADA